MLKSKLMIASMSLVFLILVAGLASAGLGTSGSKLEKEVTSGEHITHLMQVKTDASDQSMDIQVEILGYGQSQDGAKRELNASQDISPYTARPFLSVSPSSFHLDPGKTQDVTLEGDIPKDVGSGSRYALVKIHSGAMGEGTVGFILGIDVPILLTVSGSEILDSGEIENLSLEQPISADKQTMSLSFKNTGNHHYLPKVDAVVKDKDGSIVSNVPVPSPISLLPTYSRLFKFDLNPNTPIKPGTYNLNATVSADGNVLATKEVSFEVKS
jgi:hypothetical protein